MTMPSFDHDTAHDSPHSVPISGTVCALVADPVGRAVGGWQIGDGAAPTPLDPVAARAARLEARLSVYAQYAAVVAEEAAAAVAGDAARRNALTSERDAAAEHFAELRGPPEHDASGCADFSLALTDALHELRHQDAVDDALGRRLRALRDAAVGRDAARDASGEPCAALAAGPAGATRLDLRF